MIKKKLSLNSYKPSFQKYGPDILIMTIQDPLFDESTLTVIEKKKFFKRRLEEF